MIALPSGFAGGRRRADVAPGPVIRKPGIAVACVSVAAAPRIKLWRTVADIVNIRRRTAGASDRRSGRIIMATTLEQQMRRALGFDLVTAARHDGALPPAAKSAARRQSPADAATRQARENPGNWPLAQLLRGRLC